MNLCIYLEVHAYAEDELCDEVFDDAPFYGINGPEIMHPLAINRGTHFNLDYNEHTLTKDIVLAIKKKLGYDNLEISAPVRYSFLVGTERYYFDFNADFSSLLTKYLDPDNTGSITVGLLVSCNAGDVGREDGLRYFVHSRESGRHNLPHIHVEDAGHNYEVSLAIETGDLLAGHMPGKLLKKARKKLDKEKSYFMDCWVKMTDGLVPDINHHFGSIGY